MTSSYVPDVRIMAKQDRARLQSVFSQELSQIFDQTVRPVLEDGNSLENEANETRLNKLLEGRSESWSCSFCQVTFSDVQQQREHYRLDWHRYNLKQSLQSRPRIKEEDFNKKTENDDVSSISGSEEEEEDSLDTIASAQGKIFLKNQQGLVFSLYRGIFLFDKKEEVSSLDFFKCYKENCCVNKQWTIIMLGGGHFAGAIFNDSTPILHKTFHCYTVRAGQGGSQSAIDGKSGGSHPKSAGASLRRYNEQALVDHVRNILLTWNADIEKSSLIFYRASGPYNRGVLFGGKEPLLNKSDRRLRTVPFSTGRATFTEVKRVHFLLTTVKIYESLNQAASTVSNQRSSENNSPKRNKTRTNCINRAKSREIVQRPLPGEISLSEEEDEEKIELNNDVLEVSFDDLKEFGDSLTAEQRKIGRNKKKPRKSKNQKLKEREEERKRHLIDVTIKGNIILLEELFQKRLKTFEEGCLTRQELCKEFFNELLDEQGNSFLHLAALNEHEDLLKYLLDNEADPCLKNKNLQTPYSCSASKVSRDVFKQFAKENSEKYNYNKAQIPINALTDEELAEKKRAQKKIKKEKEKEKKRENHIKQKEREQIDRFLHLSDREKRALAAERRILNSQGKVVSRCFLCGSDMAGKVPFEYLENRFCTIDCLKSHRLKTSLNI
ncbi:hypothetical protein ABEB36_010017 [Hypothenemus hampei]|uniref:VLRF1 domain-containing protein n=1 Tax=Hypothenemus hampei TaxID=57062 RepID=A0ABD1EI86_HYPHA